MNEPSCAKRPKYGPLTQVNHVQKFSQKFPLAEFNTSKLCLAPHNAEFNNCLKIPHYECNMHSLSGKKRRGVAQIIGPAPSYQVHVDMAYSLHSPLSICTPIPDDLGEALDLIAYSSEHSIRALWAERLTIFQNLSGRAAPISREWYKSTPQI